MAVFRPDPLHLRAQLQSLADQTHDHTHLVAVIADTCSGGLVGELAEATGLDFTLIPSDFELDAVRAFETGLSEALRLIESRGPTGGEALIALCDQDDIWHPDRLEKGIAALAASGADLVHSDARLVEADGKTLRQRSMFAFERRKRNPGLRGLLYRNNITGMTVLMRPRVARLALPFPAQSGVHFYHDLWLGLMAAATGGVHLIREPLVDYRQHGTNAIGAVDRRRGWRGGTKRPDAMWLRREAAAYALARYLAQSTYNRIADATADGRLKHGQARVAPLRPFLRRLRGGMAHLWDAALLGLQGKPGLARIAAGFAIVSIGRTIWTLREALSTGLNAAINGFDTRLYSLSPGVLPEIPVSMPEPDKPGTDHTGIIDLRKEPCWTPDFSAEDPALTILVPTLNPTEIFAGIVTALDIGLGLAARGYRVRFVATDLPISSPGTSRSFILRRLGHAASAQGAAERISLHCGVQSKTLPAHSGDIFLATAWWSAHVAEKLIRRHGYSDDGFFYLIQDYEPHFYAWGQEYADAMASYDFNFAPVFNTTLLRDFFAAQGFGFATPDALAFHPSIDIARYSRGQRDSTRTGPRRLALYGRPDVPRNMYATAVEALAQFVEHEDLGPDDIELISIGQRHGNVTLPGGNTLKSLGKLPWEDYPDYLRSVDLGLSLMYSPHPSHPPIEMAAAGVRVVTNHFGPKDLGQLSPAIVSVPATAPDLARALSTAWQAGPVPQQDREIDLTQLGLDPERMIDQLADRLAPRLPRERAPAIARKIILHIGSPKCGSTYLQHALLQNAEHLLTLGIRYPQTDDGHPGNAGDLADLTREAVEAMFADGVHTVILSHEDLYSLSKRGRALAQITAEAGISVQLVAFLRPFSDFVFGDYSQFMKQHFQTFLADRKPYGGRDFAAFAQRRITNMNPAAYLRNWSRLFPGSPLILDSHKNIRQVFDDLLDHPAGLNWEVPLARTNPSLRMEDCDRLAAAMRDPAVPEDEIRDMFLEAFHHTQEPDAGRSQARVAWLEEQFRPQNDALLAQFGFDNTLTGAQALQAGLPHSQAGE